ncbi:MAG: hypothetical protein Kow00121_13920 [Elainellaceae cyanobacterium]
MASFNLLKTSVVSIIPRAGDLDTSFGANGKVVTPIGNANDYGYSILLQKDGKIIIAGSTFNGRDLDFAIARYTSDGNLDASFGTAGKVVTDFGGTNDYGYSIALQTDGKIILVGSSSTGVDEDVAIARYTSEGRLDTSFGLGGKVLDNFSLYDYGYSVALQPDGKLVVAGSIYSNNANDDFALIRYNSDGSLDSDFNGNGLAATDFGNNDYGYSLALQTDGKIVVAGETSTGTGTEFALTRYNPNGTLDTSFGVNGRVTTRFSNYNYGSAVRVQPDGKIVVAGYSSFTDSNDTDFALARYHSDGSPDLTFGTNGKVVTPLGSSFDSKLSLAIQPDGKLVIAGSINGDFALLRYRRDGSLDLSFGKGTGKVITDFGNLDGGSGVAIQPDGKIVMAGYASSGSNTNFSIARFIGNQAPTEIALSNDTVAENSPVGTMVGVLSALDPDPDDRHTYRLLNDAGGRFALDQSKIVVANAALLDFESATRYTIRVQTTDENNAAFEQDLVLTLTDISEQTPQEPPTTDCPLKFGVALPSIPLQRLKRGIRVVGTYQSEFLRGTPRSDTLHGRGGNDRLVSGYGKARFGRDRLHGGRGQDQLYGGKGNDLIDGGNGNDRLYGKGGRDRLEGKKGNDRMISGRGNDLLLGGIGNDTLVGGYGKDTFVFETLTDGIDLIKDFKANDYLDLRRIFAQPEFKAATSCTQLMELLQFAPVGADTHLQIDLDGVGAGGVFQTIAILRNSSIDITNPASDLLL